MRDPLGARHRAIAPGIAAIAALGLLASGAVAVARPAFHPPRAGLWLMPSDRSGTLYGASSPDADWAVAQWNIPQDLPGFANGVAQNGFASVRIEGGGGFVLSQTGDALSCTKTYDSGRSDVHEFDLFLRPVNDAKSGAPRADILPAPVVGALSSLVYSATVQPLAVSFRDAGCPVTRAMFQTAVVLVNQQRHQTLFYQLRLASVEPHGGTAVWALPPPFWYRTGRDTRQNKGNTFGYDDDITSLGQPAAVLGRATHYTIDLLPRLKQIIAEGDQYGMEQDLGGWTLRGAYSGQISWGHTRSSSRWSGISIDQN